MATRLSVRIDDVYLYAVDAIAESTLRIVTSELLRLNRSAANSLLEGMEETLTLHRLGVFEELGKSLKPTNCIENLNSQLV